MKIDVKTKIVAEIEFDSKGEADDIAYALEWYAEHKNDGITKLETIANCKALSDALAQFE